VRILTFNTIFFLYRCYPLPDLPVVASGMLGMEAAFLPVSGLALQVATSHKNQMIFSEVGTL
jgi:hypothetical protein